MEAIVYETPIIVNKIPAVVEYLGTNYPLYFTTQKEAETLLNSPKKLKAAHIYLKKMDKTKFSNKFFLNSFMNSQIYQLLMENCNLTEVVVKK